MFEDMEKQYAKLAIQKTDEYYNIEKPAGTTIEYDPNCTDYAYVPETEDKNNIKVIICPKALSDGPGLLASTKIHELEHARQVKICYSSKPGFWENCTWWGHLAERLAYDLEERYYDACVTSDMPPSEKALIIERRAEHSKALKETPKPEIKAGNIKGHAGEVATVPVAVYNPDIVPHVVNVTFSNELGWTMFPPTVEGLLLNPEQVETLNVQVQVPFEAEVRSVNAFNVVAETNPTSGTDTVMIYVPPDINVTPGPDTMGARGDMVEVSFMVSNDGFFPEMVHVEVTNPLGWLTVFTSPTLSLMPMQVAEVKAQVLVDAAATSRTTNLVFCTANSLARPLHTSTQWVPIVVKERDIACLAVESPIDSYQSGEIFTPIIVVKNNGHVDSFFDVFLVIEPAGGGGPISSEQITVPSLLPGQMAPVAFPARGIAASGAYTAKARVVLSGDMETWNDKAFGSFDVQPPSSVSRWKQY